MQDRLIGGVFALAKQQRVDYLQEHRREHRQAALTLVRIGRALLSAREERRDAFEALDAVMDWTEVQASIERAEKLTDPRGFETLAHVGSHYRSIRMFAPTLLEVFDFEASEAKVELLEALRVLRELNRTGKRRVPDSAPRSFVAPRWEPYVETESGLDRRYYELCLLSEVRAALRSGDLFVRDSHHYRNFDDYLLPPRESLGVLRQVGSAESYLEQRSREISEAVERVGSRLQAGELETLRLEPSGRIRLRRSPSTRARNENPWPRTVHSLLPRIRITDLLEEVDRWTGFSHAFTHLRTGEEASDSRVLLAAILADGLNLGPTKMAEACSQVRFRQLAWTADWLIREETYQRALAEIVNHQHRHPFARHWGKGATSSSDGQRFRAGGRGAAYGQRNARYGRDPSVMLYTHTSDQYSPYHATVIDASSRDATYVLDGLLEHRTELAIEEHYTDTAGFTDHVFALCFLLGFRFAPRIRSLTKYRLYFVDPVPSTCLEPLVAGAASSARIRRSWDSILRLAASIQAGTVSSSLILRKLAAYPRQNELAWALREMGRLERSLFTLRWFEDPAVEGRVVTGLNKSEEKNNLARAVFINRLGEFRDRSPEDQLHRASGLNLVIAAISLWNTVYLDRAVKELERRGQVLSDEAVASLSPIIWDHINLTGDYNWTAEGRDAEGFRPLRTQRLDGP